MLAMSRTFASQICSMYMGQYECFTMNIHGCRLGIVKCTNGRMPGSTWSGRGLEGTSHKGGFVVA